MACHPTPKHGLPWCLALPRQAASIYSPAFQAPAPEDRFLRFSLHAGSVDACGLYRNNFASTEPVIFLRITTNHARGGRYRIVEHEAEASGDSLAQARIIRSEAGFKAVSYPASTGYLDVAMPPVGGDERHAEISLTGKVHIGFAHDPIVNSECRASGDAAGHILTSECSCTRASGEWFSCDRGSGDSNCCVSDSSATLFYDAEFSANLCPALCAFTDPEIGSQLPGARVKMRVPTILFLMWGFACQSEASGPEKQAEERDARADASTEAGEPACVSSCETGDWPRLIVGVLGSQEPQPVVTAVRAIDGAGQPLQGVPSGCPETTAVVCSYSWSTGRNDTQMTLEAELDRGTIVSTDVTLAPLNYCARDITYVTLDVTVEPVMFGTPRLVSPCLDAAQDL